MFRRRAKEIHADRATDHHGPLTTGEGGNHSVREDASISEPPKSPNRDSPRRNCLAPFEPCCRNQKCDGHAPRVSTGSRYVSQLKRMTYQPSAR